MRKAQKRELGRIKQEKNLAESIESGRKAQDSERARRERMEQQALIARDKNSVDSKSDKGPKKSKIAQEKAERVAAKLVEKKFFDALVEPDLGQDLPTIDLKRTQS